MHIHKSLGKYVTVNWKEETLHQRDFSRPLFFFKLMYLHGSKYTIALILCQIFNVNFMCNTV